MTKRRGPSYAEQVRKALDEIELPSLEDLIKSGSKLFKRMPPASETEGRAPRLPWFTRGPTSRRIRWDYAEPFDARGMRRLYGRGDCFSSWTANMDVWRTKDGPILARFWSRADVDPYSFEVFGLKVPALGKGHVLADGERWIPECLRREYEGWVTSEYRL